MNIAMIRLSAPLLATGLAICTLTTYSATAHATNPCTEALSGNWSYNDGACSSTVTSIRGAITTLSVSVAPDAVGDATVSLPVRDYLRARTNNWRDTAATMIRASNSSIDVQSFSHGPLKSIVLHEVQQTVGNTANNAYQTFTFDLAANRRLQLADLFKAGIDPLIALPPLLRPYLVDALDRAQPPHEPGTYPFTPDNFEPQPDGSGYATNYRAFAVTETELVLYLPDAPMTHENPFPQDRLQWSMDGGTVTVRVPLAALAPIIRAI